MKGTHGMIYQDENTVIKVSHELSRCIGEIFILERLSKFSPHLMQCEDYKLESTEPGIECKIFMTLGTPLRDRVGTMLTPFKLRVIDQIISGLVDMQSFGFIHGDIKIDNILLIDDTVKIIDFGIITGHHQIDKVPVQTYRIPYLEMDYVSKAMFALGITICDIIDLNHRLLEPNLKNFTETVTVFMISHFEYYNFINSTLLARPCPDKFSSLLNHDTTEKKTELLTSSVHLNVQEVPLSFLPSTGPFIYNYCALHKISSSIAFDAVKRLSHLQTVVKIEDKDLKTEGLKIEDKDLKIEDLKMYSLAAIIFAASCKGQTITSIDISDEIISALRIIISKTYLHQTNEQISSTELLLFCHHPEYHNQLWKEKCNIFHRRMIKKHKIRENDPNMNMVTYLKTILSESGILDLERAIYVDNEKRVDYFLNLKNTNIPYISNSFRYIPKPTK